MIQAPLVEEQPEGMPEASAFEEKFDQSDFWDEYLNLTLIRLFYLRHFKITKFKRL